MNVVVVHRGARDNYQVALALAERNQLERLVTDVYWPEHSALARGLDGLLGGRLSRTFRPRSAAALPSRLVDTNRGAGYLSFALDRFRAPFAWRARATRATDHALGHYAGRLARTRGAAILSYSYYGYSAFEAAGERVPRILFQLHPHPRSMRRILGEELRAHPDCATSLGKEWELALPQSDWERLCAETGMPGDWIAASSFTRRTLIENGAPPERVHVAPYGVDLDRFQPGPEPPSVDGPLRILFVGTINQRKGIKYLLEAVRLLKTDQLQLVIRGRAVDGLELIQRMVPGADVRLDVSREELAAAYQQAHLFVFPSVAEGFAHVLLEALASGLPILSTTATAAPDLIGDDEAGWTIDPGRPEQIAARLEWALRHRAELGRMRADARRAAEQFTWPRFRARVAAIVEDSLSRPAAASRESEQLLHV